MIEAQNEIFLEKSDSLALQKTMVFCHHFKSTGMYSPHSAYLKSHDCQFPVGGISGDQDAPQRWFTADTTTAEGIVGRGCDIGSIEDSRWFSRSDQFHRVEDKPVPLRNRVTGICHLKSAMWEERENQKRFVYVRDRKSEREEKREGKKGRRREEREREHKNTLDSS